MTSGLRLISAGCALGDLLSEVQNHDPVGDVHDHAHVVLDEDDAPDAVPEDGRVRIGVPLPFEDIDDEAGDILLLLQVHPGHRFVQERTFGSRARARASSTLLRIP